MEIQMENIFTSNKSVHYHEEMTLEKEKRTEVDFLLKVTENALLKEQTLFQDISGKENIFVHLKNQEMVGLRCGALEVCKEHLVEINELRLEEVDKKLIQKLDILPGKEWPWLDLVSFSRCLTEIQYFLIW